MSGMFQRLAIPEVFIHTPKRFADERGFFMETFNAAAMEPMTGPAVWVQDNHSRSEPVGTVRGLHFQVPPFAQDKLVRCIAGAVLDVAVDIRHGSPTFGRHVASKLTASGGEQIFVPRGFAHGFVTLDRGCEIAYKVTNYYSFQHDRGLRWNDPALEIEWGLGAEKAVLSAKDAAAPMLAELPVSFWYGHSEL